MSNAQFFCARNQHHYPKPKDWLTNRNYGKLTSGSITHYRRTNCKASWTSLD
jgi:hypothetical protein